MVIPFFQPDVLGMQPLLVPPVAHRCEVALDRQLQLAAGQQGPDPLGIAGPELPRCLFRDVCSNSGPEVCRAGCRREKAHPVHSPHDGQALTGCGLFDWRTAHAPAPAVERTVVNGRQDERMNFRDQAGQDERSDRVMNGRRQRDRRVTRSCAPGTPENGGGTRSLRVRSPAAPAAVLQTTPGWIGWLSH